MCIIFENLILFLEKSVDQFYLVIYCDDVCIPKWNVALINKYLNNFDNDNWDCISFNRSGYYDKWALLFDDFKHHCWGFNTPVQNKTAVKIMKNTIIHKLNNAKHNSIEVISAFNGFAIYRTSRFKGCYYDGLYSNVKKLITENERNATLKLFKQRFNVNFTIHATDECCEHIFYHLSAIHQGCKIKISKFKIM